MEEGVGGNRKGGEGKGWRERVRGERKLVGEVREVMDERESTKVDSNKQEGMSTQGGNHSSEHLYITAALTRTYKAIYACRE